MEKLSISFESSPEEILFGIHFMQCEAMDELGNVEEGLCLSFGFIFFLINIYIRK